MKNLKNECQRLRSRIVSNPDKLKQAIRDMNTSLKQDKKTTADSERKARDIQGKIEMMNQVEQDIAVCLKLLDDAYAAKVQRSTAASKQAQEKDRLERKETELNELVVAEQVAEMTYIAITTPISRSKG